ncbi:hypothetical protein [Enterococcus sp. DIV0800]|uniref:hypothetical protein n=1 Tax=unclassified Enterococcus TaxID=2608891 RepID=UPI003D2FB4EB
MVEWKDLGEKAFGAAKDITEKGVDSFQEWKDDPERIAKVEEKKALKKATKQIKKVKNKKVKKIDDFKEKSESVNNPTYIVKSLGITTITILDKAILIDRTGSLQTFKGKNFIPLDKITSVQIQQASSFNNGYIHFSVPGGIQPRNGLLNAS